VRRRKDQTSGQAKPWSKSHFITLYESQPLAEDEVLQLSVVGKGDIDNGKLVNKAVRIESGIKPGLKVYQVSGTGLAAADLNIIKALDVIRSILKGKYEPPFESLSLGGSGIYKEEYWVWGMVPANMVKRAISFKTIFAAKMGRLDESDQKFHDAVEEQGDEFEDRAKLRGGARTIQTARKSTRGVAQPAENKGQSSATSNTVGKHTYFPDEEDDVVEEDEDVEENVVPHAAAPMKRAKRRTQTFTSNSSRSEGSIPATAPSKKTTKRPKQSTTKSTATATSQTNDAAASAPKPARTWGPAPLTGDKWPIRDMSKHRWARDNKKNLKKDDNDEPYLEYFVKWEDTDDKKWSHKRWDSWEPEDHFAEKVVQTYWKEQKERKPAPPADDQGEQEMKGIKLRDRQL
jgi:hypothetical protein